MIQCENIQEQDLDRIGRQIAAAFLAEPGAFAELPADTAAGMFRLIVQTCYETGHLYTTSEKQEGFCVYWTKAERPGLWPQLKMMCRMAVQLPVRPLLKVMKQQKGWTQTEDRYQKSPDFVEVFLLAVRPEYQGQGWFRKMLEELFALAEQRRTICVLDTDSPTKADKYCHVGMHIADSRRLDSGVEMFALEK